MTDLIGKRIPVLDKGYVELVDCMPHPASGYTFDNAIVTAARVSFMGESKGEVADAKLIHYLMKHSHSSPFEQAQFKFRCKMPLLVERQWTRHRSFRFTHANAQSFRYTEAEEDDFYIPSEWRLQSPSNKQGSEGLLEPDGNGEWGSRQFTDLLNKTVIHDYTMYQLAIDKGVAREQARLFLPAFALYTTWIMSVDAWNLLHFLKLRMDEHAQYEIRVYANALYTEFVKPMMPITAEAFESYMMNMSGEQK